MDIFDVITADHEKVKKILEQMQHTTSKAGKRREQLLQSLTENLQPHMYAEEQYFYQVLLDETDEKETAFEAIEEHRAAKMVLADLHEATVGRSPLGRTVQGTQGTDRTPHRGGRERGLRGRPQDVR